MHANELNIEMLREEVLQVIICLEGQVPLFHEAGSRKSYPVISLPGDKRVSLILCTLRCTSTEYIYSPRSPGPQDHQRWARDKKADYGAISGADKRADNTAVQ